MDAFICPATMKDVEELFSHRRGERCRWLTAPRDASHDLGLYFCAPSYGGAISRAAKVCGTFLAVH